MKAVVQPVKGTRDFYPELMAIRSWLYHTIGEVTASFGYEEYEAPILEKVELYAAKSGEELVNEQAFVFEDRAATPLHCAGTGPIAGPHGGPAAARADLSLHWWSFGPFGATNALKRADRGIFAVEY